ncbi:MAG TPA: S8 family serine peptidase [Solirubrobacteraceae bacterium]|nr:S8 family serine peptidase [Solirubrobacteraceae bacterium]
MRRRGIAILGVALLAPACARADTPTGRVLVSLTARAGAHVRAGKLHTLLAHTGARRSGPEVPEIGLVTVSPLAGRTLAPLLRALRAQPAVRSAEPEQRMALRFVPNDPALSARDPVAASVAVEWQLEREGLYGAWDVTRGEGARVGVVDTGADGAHPDLAGKLDAAVQQDSSNGAGPANSDQNGHGTHVAGLACANTNNGIGLAGAGYDCHLVIERTDLTDASVAASIVDATNRGVESINMSFGSTPGRAPVQAIVDALDYAYSHGVVLVAAAANNPDEQQGQPADLLQPTGSGPDIAAGKGLTVTAADFSDQRASFAGFGSQISLAAYGSFAAQGGPRGIFSTFPGNSTELETGGRGILPLLPGQAPCACRTTFAGDSRYAYLEGTSMAAPQVAAIAALVRRLNPDIGVAEVVRLLKQTARRPPGGGWAPDLGWGIVDANAAVQVARAIDHRPPSSSVSAPAQVRGRTIPLALSGSDPVANPALIASGIDHFDVYASRDGGPYNKVASTQASSLEFAARPGSRYAFYSVATDRAGNREANHAQPDATTAVVAPRRRHPRGQRRAQRRR